MTTLTLVRSIAGATPSKVSVCDLHARYTAGCAECRERCRNHRRAQYRAAGYGLIQPGLCDTSEARERLLDLHDNHDVSYRQIAAQSGVRRQSIADIAAGVQQQASRNTVTAILSLTPTLKGRRRVPGRGRVSARGAARRLQALAVARYSAADLVPRLETDVQCVRRWRLFATPLISLRRHCDIDSLFIELHATPGPSRYARTHARANRWAPAGAWDDIDDPAAEPCFDAPDDGSADEVLVDEVLHGHRPFTVLNPADQIQLWHSCARYRVEYGQGGPGLVEFATRYGITRYQASVLRDKAEGRTRDRAAERIRATQKEAA